MATKDAVQARVLEDGVMMLFGVIGDPIDGFGAAQVVEDLHTADGAALDPLVISINSPGGDVAEALTIYHELTQHQGRIEITIPGVAASGASLIAMAGDVIRMAPHAQIMIHDPWLVGVGNSEELRRAADLLDRFGTSMAQIYAERTGVPEDRIREMMAADGGEGTWLTAQEAVDLGFAAEILESRTASQEQTRAFAALDPARLRRVPAAVEAIITRSKEITMSQHGTQGDPQGTPPQPPPAADPDYEAVRAAATAAAREATEAMHADQRERTAAIRAMATRWHLPSDWVTARIEAGDTVEEARAAAADWLADAQSRGGGPSWIPGGVAVRADERDKAVTAQTDWLILRSGRAALVERHENRKLDPGEMRGLSLMDMARQALDVRGISTRGMGQMEIARRALTRSPSASTAGQTGTTDFPVLLENALNKFLSAAYELQPVVWSDVAATGSVSDFRPHKRLRVGGLGNLQPKLESGEFRWIHQGDAEAGVVQATTKGVLLGISRQAVVNDDVDFLANRISDLGQAAARSIDAELFALIQDNGGLGPTIGPFRVAGAVEGAAAPMFDAGRSNIAATGAPPTQAALEAMRVLMARQRDPEGSDFIDLRPSVWVGPVELGAQVRESIGAEFSDLSGDDKGARRKPNVVRDLLDVIVDTPRLTGTRWYTFASPAIAPAFEVAFLDGQTQPVIEADESIQYDGVVWLVRHDFGVAGVDFRPAATNAGA